MSDLAISHADDLPRCITPSSKIGRIVSVSGGRVVALLEGGEHATAGLQVGTLVKIVRSTTLVFGIVEELTIPMISQHEDEQESRLAEIHLVGEVADATSRDGRLFRRGVSSVPCLDDPVLAADSADTSAVYALPQRQVVRIGTVHQDSTVSAYLSVDDLLGRHFAIVGATGAGKSCALALLLHGIIKNNANAHVLLLDPHGEYGDTFGDQAEHLTVDRLRLPYWVLEFEELVEIIFGTEKETVPAEIAIFRQLVLKAKLAYLRNRPDSSSVSVDTPTPYTMTELNLLLDLETGRLANQTSLGPLIRLKTRLDAIRSDRRYSFLFPNELVLRDDLADILGQLFRVPTNKKPLCTLDLSKISGEILNVVVAVLTRLAFNVAMLIGQKAPLLLVCEEAHRYAPQDTGLGFEPAKRSLARIAKEGRKYGISLGLLSQRPSELAISILSQCSTVVAFRMVNHADQEVIQAMLSDASSALVNSLPLLGNGEAVIVGEGIAVPMRLKLAHLPPEQRPRSNSAKFSRLWQQQDVDVNVEQLQQVVDRWRGLSTTVELQPGQIKESTTDPRTL